MKNLKNKMKDQKGFTLIEMLIVVAIIAVLISVSIPLVSQSLEKAKRATDAANERSAKAAILTEYLTNPAFTAVTAPVSDSAGISSYTHVYNAVDGKIEPKKNVYSYGQCSAHDNCYLALAVDKDGIVYYSWFDTSNGRKAGKDIDEVTGTATP